MTLFLHALGHSIFLGRGAAIDGYDVPPVYAAALLVCVPANKKASARGVYIFSRTVWVGRKGYRCLTTLCGRTFCIHAGESRASEKCIVPFCASTVLFLRAW